MLRSILGRTVASTVAIGTVLAAVAIAGPAAVVSAPSLALVACQDNYPNPIATRTNLTLGDSFVQYGTRQRANVTVSSTAGRRPTGTVRFVVDGRSWAVALSNGEASLALPRGLDASETYTVRARFVPDCNTGQFGPSSDSQALTVFKADTRIGSVLAPNVKRGKKATVRAVLSTRTKSPHGKAVVTIWKGGQKMKKTVKVDAIGSGDSVIRARFGKVRDLGSWNVKIKYLGNEDCEKATKFTKFKVVR
jgi:hypothetical protein